MKPFALGKDFQIIPELLRYTKISDESI